jgi:hypothetical protein
MRVGPKKKKKQISRAADLFAVSAEQREDE